MEIQQKQLPAEAAGTGGQALRAWKSVLFNLPLSSLSLSPTYLFPEWGRIWVCGGAAPPPQSSGKILSGPAGPQSSDL